MIPQATPTSTASDILYVVMTPPPNSKSAGITYLNDLTKFLRSIGRNVIQLFSIYPKEQLVIWGAPSIPNQNHWQVPWKDHWIPCAPGQLASVFKGRKCIVIHGENQHFKWYEGLHVVRYYLYTIDGLEKKGVSRDGEFKLAWNELFCLNSDHVLNKSLVRYDLEKAKALSTESRSVDLTYIGKAWLHLEGAGRIDRTLELTRTWPSNDDEYFYLLSKTRFLYTYDPVTSVIDDAITLGAFPVIMNTSPHSRDQLENSYDPAMRGCYCFYDADLTHALSEFPVSRLRYINNLESKNTRFISSLVEFCEKAEQRFFGT